jgi:beta-ribofuranosylaminobenzene 5'-phosphate synthase
MKVLVQTPARLHLGLIDLNGELGRLYGSIGVAIDGPNVSLEAERLPTVGTTQALQVDGPEAERVTAIARRFCARYPSPVPVRLHVRSVIPAHVGLGSGTQLALAVGTALAELGGLPIEPAELSVLLGRGAHSGIGIAVFQRGGFVVDGGHAPGGSDGRPPPVLFQHPFPAGWRLVVAIPAVPPGYNGESEKQAFQGLPPAPGGLADRICRLLVMQMLPALLEGEIIPFGQALTGIQALVGDSFAAVQGGRFANTVSGALIAYWLSIGACGAGQSSWGPTAYALAGDESEADRLAGAARSYLSASGGGVVFIARGANQGARISRREPVV